MDTLKLLIEAGANIHAENNQAIRWESKEGYLEIVKLLLDAGANLPDGCDELI